MPLSLEWTELIPKSLNEMKMEMRRKLKMNRFYISDNLLKNKHLNSGSQLPVRGSGLVHGTVPAVIFMREDGLRLWVLLTGSLWKKVRKFECGLVSRVRGIIGRGSVGGLVWVWSVGRNWSSWRAFCNNYPDVGTRGLSRPQQVTRLCVWNLET